MITWWCVSQEEPWTWSWVPYPGVWIASLVPLFAYIAAHRRAGQAFEAKRVWAFVAGIAAFWAASGWPIGPLGAGYLASAHMLQFLLYTLVAAPLLLIGTPGWMGERVFSAMRLTKLSFRKGKSLVAAAAVYNLGLLLTHAPITVEALRGYQLGSFFMDIVWMLMGFLLWLPVLSPVTEMRTEAPLAKVAYLLATTMLVAIIPASYLTFSEVPIYSIYELAPRIGSITAGQDQQVAGLIMKIGTVPIIWGTAAVIWFRWASEEARADSRR